MIGRARIAAPALLAALVVALAAWVWLERERGRSAMPVARPAAEPAAGFRAATPEREPIAAAPEGLAEPQADAAEHGNVVQHVESGAALSGWLLVDGGPPPEAIELTLLHAAGGDGERPATVQRTAPGGGFRFQGLTDGWSGTLRLPAGWSFERSGRVVDERRFPAPASGLELEVRRVPMLRGRVVEAGPGTPVPGASVQLLYDLVEGGGEMSSHDDATDADGRFALSLAGAHLESVTVSARDPRTGARGGSTLQGQDLGPELDVGAIEVRGRRSLAFQVLDREGAPVENAVALADSVPLVRCDDQGRGTILGLGEGEVELRFAAPAHRIRVLEAPPPEVESIEVVLERCNSLTVVVEGPADLTRGVTVQLGCALPLFPDEGRNPLRGALRGFTTSVGLRDPDGAGPELGWWLRIFEAKRSIHLDDLIVGEPVTMLASDASGARLLATEIPPLGSEERRRVVLELPDAAGAVRGRVVDGMRRPIAGARLSVPREYSRMGILSGSNTQSQGDGSFHFAPLLGPVVDLHVSKEGWAPATVRDVPVARNARPVEIRLERAVELEVEVRDPAGALVAGGGVTLAGPGSVAERGDGTFRLRGLAPAPLRATLHLAGREYVREHDPRSGPLVFGVPAHGSADVRWPPFPGDEYGVLEMRAIEEGLRVERFARLSDGLASVPALLPGTNSVRLLARGPDGSAGRALLSPSEVTVEPDATAEVELRP